jgi:hypothetical protein
MATIQPTTKNGNDNLIKLLRYLIFETNSENCWLKLNSEEQNNVLHLAIQTGTGALCYYYLRENNIVLDNNSPLNSKVFLASSAMSLQRQVQLKTIVTLLDHEKINSERRLVG